MDSSLKKQTADFKKRLIENVGFAVPEPNNNHHNVGKRNSDTVNKSKIKRPKFENVPATTSTTAASSTVFNNKDAYKTSSGSSHNNFSILAKIVKHLKVRHQKGETQPLTFDEILDETNQTDIPARTKHWLNYEALRNNVKIDVVNEDKYIYKPEYNIRGKNSLKKLLERHSRDGQGGIFLEAIEESLPNYQKHLEMMSDSIVRIMRPDKKEIIFSKVVGLPSPIDEEIKNLWRSVSVEGMNENKIQEYLQKHNITSMKNINNVRPKKVLPAKRKTSKKPTELRHNAHLAEVLMDYDKNQ